MNGKIKLGKETLGTVDGHWDRTITYHDRKAGTMEVIWEVSDELKLQRLKRYTVPMPLQGEWESKKLWQHVTAAIENGDQVAATVEKTKLEEAQRKAAKERVHRHETWIPKYFLQDQLTGEWVYRFAENRPWDERTDIRQYEHDYIIQTKTRHKHGSSLMKNSSLVLGATTTGSGTIVPLPIASGGGGSGVVSDAKASPSSPSIMLRPPSAGAGSSGSSISNTATGQPLATYTMSVIGLSSDPSGVSAMQPSHLPHNPHRYSLHQTHPSESGASDEGEASSGNEAAAAANPRRGTNLTTTTHRNITEMKHVLKQLVQHQEQTQSQVLLLGSQLQALRQTMGHRSSMAYPPAATAAAERWPTLKMNFIIALLVIFAQFVINYILAKRNMYPSSNHSSDGDSADDNRTSGV